MSTTYVWNRSVQAGSEDVWAAIASLFQGLAARPSWRADDDGQPLLVVREATALGQARELGFTVAADLRQPPSEVDWQVRDVEGRAVVSLTVIDPEDARDPGVEASWVGLLDQVCALVDQPALV